MNNKLTLPESISKSEIGAFVDETTAKIMNGELDPLAAHVRAKAVMKALELIIKQTEQLAIEETYKYPGKTFEAFGAEVSHREGTDGPNCDMDDRYTAIKLQLKDREAMLKQAYKMREKCAIYDQQTGEEIPVLPAKLSKPSIAVTFK
jgi:polyribonucleotide nucleotidyltransferase